VSGLEVRLKTGDRPGGWRGAPFKPFSSAPIEGAGVNEGRGEAPLWWSAASGSILRRVRGTGRVFERPTGTGVRDERTSDPKPSASEIADEIRTFLVADIRGYASFTPHPGDEAADRLEARFAEIVTIDRQQMHLKGLSVQSTSWPSRQKKVRLGSG
jgi:hypothetical protein